MKCLNQKCNVIDIDKNDNFCHKCGHYTSKGYTFLKDKNNVKRILNGPTIKQRNKLSILVSLFALSFIIFTGMIIVRGDDLFKPFFFIKKQMINYSYGYKTSLMNTDNKYNDVDIKDYDDAINIIKDDFIKQDILCFNEGAVRVLANSIERDYEIPSVSFCDMSINESNKIKDVIDKMYELFPNINGSLTNISITNASSNDYIARFQPMYQFVNINSYNKVNKTQILINSYYFLNEDIISKPIENSLYVEDATWESTIAHEYGHYISFVTLLHKYGIDNITLVTKDNEELINRIIDEFNDGKYSLEILSTALNNYNDRYEKELTILEFASSISPYAASLDEEGVLIADETIAEAIHDYYLHGDNMKDQSKEIVSVISTLLW